MLHLRIRFLLLAIVAVAGVGGADGLGEDLIGGENGGDAIETHLVFLDHELHLHLFVEVSKSLVTSFEVITDPHESLGQGGRVD